MGLYFFCMARLLAINIYRAVFGMCINKIPCHSKGFYLYTWSVIVVKSLGTMCCWCVRV